MKKQILPNTAYIMTRNNLFLPMIRILIFITFCWLYPIKIQPQNIYTQEYVTVSPKTASVGKWITWLETEKKLSLSYNNTMIDIDERISFTSHDTITIKEFLDIILYKDFVYIQENPNRKLTLKTKARPLHQITGTVYENGTFEKLDDAFVSLKEIHTHKYFTALTEGGIFSFQVPEGTYNLRIHYIGYQPINQHIKIGQSCKKDFCMHPLSVELKEAMIRPEASSMELDESLPSNKLTVTNSDIFSQMNILPGVIGSPLGVHFQVNGGADDENLLLIDGVPLYHYGHMNTLMSPFNGDAIKNITFHRNYFPTPFEGRISSVTEVHIKEGNKKEHIRTLSLNMPSVSAVFEGPVIKNHMSYLIGARHSWLDFFDKLVRDELRMNHSYFDLHGKLAFNITPVHSLEIMGYNAHDNYYFPTENNDTKPILQWRNQLYRFGYKGLLGKKITLSSFLSYTDYTNLAETGDEEYEELGYLKSNIQSLSWNHIFGYQQESDFQANWGIKITRDMYGMAIFGDSLYTQKQPVIQLSLFYDNKLHITPKISVQVGLNYVYYMPAGYKKYHSIQPRGILKYAINNRHLIYAGVSRMEQFYHYLSIEGFSLPTDFRMPSIAGFQPRSSEHYESGWKFFIPHGYLELSAFYKSRRHIVALRPEAYPSDNKWHEYIMTGNGRSYGVKLYLAKNWNRLSLQLSYAFIRSKEKYPDLSSMGWIRSLNDIPHACGTAISYRISKYSSVSIGGEIRSGKIYDNNDHLNTDFLTNDNSSIITDNRSDDIETTYANQFRSYREPLMYRLDAGYGFQKQFRHCLLGIKAGLYNIVGNPPTEEIQSFYFINYQRNCLPYASISLRF